MSALGKIGSYMETLSDETRICVERLVRAEHESERLDLWVLVQYNNLPLNRLH